MKRIKLISKKLHIIIPSVILNNTDLSATDKIILSWFTGFDKENNTLTTDYIAQTLKLSTSAIRASIKRLVFLDLLKETYYYARKRMFTSTIEKTEDDAPVILTNEILTSEVSSTYKISMGIIVASSLGENNNLNGYNFNKIDELIEILGLSKSSVYRHLKLLQELGQVTRDTSSTWLLRPHTEYTDKKFAIRNKKKRSEKTTEQKTSEYVPPNITDANNKVMESFYNNF